MTQPAVLIVEDDPNLREAMLDTLQTGEHPVFAAATGAEALTIIGRETIGLVVSDDQLAPVDGHALLDEIRQRHPSLPAVLMTAHGGVAETGAADYLVKPFAPGELTQLVAKYMKSPAGGEPIAVDARTTEILRIAGRVAATDATVTISGESGCGKEVFARYIHRHSPRRNRPFIAINCAAIPESMLEAVLFGYEKGAFTGAAAAHAGKFEQAEGGTLLLDEVSEMELGLQAKLLRVIQEREVERLGGREVIKLDVRVLATTNRDLRRQVTEGLFREDLYYRLNVFPLHLPALRARPGDIVPLALLAVRKHWPADRPAPRLSDCARRRLLDYGWPGNVRELENVLQRSLILLAGDTLTAADLLFETHDAAEPAAPGTTNALQDDLKDREYRVIIDALREADGNRRKVAERLRISPRTLRYKLARMRDDGVTLPAEIRR